MGDARFLRFFGDFGLGLGCCSHERDQGIANCLLHWVVGRSVEDHPIDHCLNADSATNELPHGVGHILVISPQPVHPAHHERVALPQDIEKSPPFRAFAKASRDTRYAVVSQHQIRFKSNLVSLGSLVLEGLVDGAYPAIENSFHRLALMPAGASSI